MKKEKLGIELSVKGLYYEHASRKPEGGSKVGVNEFGLNVNSLLPTVGVSREKLSDFLNWLAH